MGGGGSPPPAPDPRLAIPDQEAANRRAFEQQVREGRPDVVGPGGMSQWSRDAGGNWTNRVTLDPNLQGMRDQLSQPFDNSGFLRDRTPQYDAGTRQRAEDALYARSTSRLDPQWDRAEQRSHERLLGQGFNIQDEGYRSTAEDLGRQRTDAYADARNAAIAGGGQEASQELERALQSAEFGQRSDLANIDVRNADRDRIARELQTLMPNFNAGGGGGGVPGLASVDVMGAGQQNYQNQLGTWNAQQGRRDARTGAIVSGVGTAAMIAIMI